MPIRKWTDLQLRIALSTSLSKAETIRKLGLSSHGAGNFRSLERHILRLNLSTSHFLPSTRVPAKSRPLSDILCKNSDGSSNLKNRLMKARLLLLECSKCSLVDWMGQRIILQLDHIDGDRRNYLLSNLRLLCPNCHSQTPTYSRGKKRKVKKHCSCGAVISRSSKSCMACNHILKVGKKLKVQWPSLDILMEMVKKLGFRGAGKKLGVSDNAVRKHVKGYSRYSVSRVGVEPTPPDFQSSATAVLASETKEHAVNGMSC
jgi:Zn finger protein HypA/HybF involved in hydrogenase expression